MAPRTIRHLTSAHAADDPRIFRRQCKSVAGVGNDVGLIVCDDRAEVRDGVRIMPVDRPRGRFDRMTRVCWRIRRAAARERADLYHFHHPELLWVGAVLRLRGAHVVYDVHEDVPKQILSKPWIPRWARPLVSRAVMLVERVGAQLVDGIVAATPTVARKSRPARPRS